MDPAAHELIKLVSGLGAAAGPVFAFLFWLERAERKEVARAKDQLTERALVSITETANAINTLKSILGKS